MTPASSGTTPSRALSLREVSKLTGGRTLGGIDETFVGVAPLETAGPRELGFLAARRYLGDVEDTRAGALLVSEELAARLRPDFLPAVVVPDPHAALLRLLPRFHPPKVRPAGVDPTARIDPAASLGEGVAVEAFAVIGPDAVVGDRSWVGSHSVVGRGVRMGTECRLHAHVTLYPGTVLGDRVELHSGARIGVDGFGYTFQEGRHRKIPQVGQCVIEDDVEIGANVCIDRGSIGETRVGEGTKVDNLVHLGHNTTIGRHAVVVAQVGIAGSARVGDGAMLGGQAGIGGHIRIGPGARVGAQAGVMGDLDPGAVVSGYPARPHREYLRAMSRLFKLPELLERVAELERKVGAQDGSGEDPAFPPTRGDPEEGE